MSNRRRLKKRMRAANVERYLCEKSIQDCPDRVQFGQCYHLRVTESGIEYGAMRASMYQPGRPA